MSVAPNFQAKQNILIACLKVCFVRPGSIEITDVQ